MVHFKQQLLNRRRAASLRTTVALSAACAAALLAMVPLTSSAAQPERSVVALGDDPPAMLVRYGDLNLATDSGARILLQRIRFAADTVCPAADNRDVGQVAAHNRCVRVTTASAVQHVGNARLAAVYSSRSLHG